MTQDFVNSCFYFINTALLDFFLCLSQTSIDGKFAKVGWLWPTLELEGLPHDEWLLDLRRPGLLTQEVKPTTDL